MSGYDDDENDIDDDDLKKKWDKSLSFSVWDYSAESLYDVSYNIMFAKDIRQRFCGLCRKNQAIGISNKRLEVLRTTSAKSFRVTIIGYI